MRNYQSCYLVYHRCPACSPNQFIANFRPSSKFNQLIRSRLKKHFLSRWWQIVPNLLSNWASFIQAPAVSDPAQPRFARQKPVQRKVAARVELGLLLARSTADEKPRGLFVLRQCAANFARGKSCPFVWKSANFWQKPCKYLRLRLPNLPATKLANSTTRFTTQKHVSYIITIMLHNSAAEVDLIKW